MRLLRVLGVGGMVVSGLAAGAGAEPYLAVREGLKCSACHVNVTGGGKRTDLLAAHARDVLGYPDVFEGISRPADAFSGRVNEYVAVGGNLRVRGTAVMQDEPDAQGRVENNTALRGHLDEYEVDVFEAVGFLQVDLVPGWLTLYGDQSLADDVFTREVWAMVRLPGELQVKVGRMFLPYGLQVEDDRAFTRDRTGFSFDVQETALEGIYEPGPFSFVAAVSEGKSGDRDLRVTGTAYALLTEIPVLRNVLLGGSFSRRGGGPEQLRFALFGGTNLGPFTYLGEVDFLEDKGSQTGGEWQGVFSHHSEARYLLFDWLNVLFAFDYADDDGIGVRTNDAENRFRFGVEPFLAKFLQLRLFYEVLNGVETRPERNQDLWIAEAHVFF